MKAILIDPVARTVTDHEYDGNWKTIAPTLGCELFTVATVLPTEDTLYVDDEGLLKDEPAYFFTINGYPGVLAGRGLVVGCDEAGDSKDAVVSRETVEWNIHWLGQHPEWMLA